MKTFKFILLALVVSNTITAQKNVRPTKNLDSYEGTWIYQKNDIIFKIKLQKGQEAWRNDLINGLYGGYYLSVRGEVLENYMGELPTCWDVLKECQPNNLFIWAYSPYTDELGSLGIIFYDQRKRHFGGKGITGGYIQLLSPTKIRWKLDEEKGIWNETEGDESISDAGRRPIGFSVPDDVIMTKE